MLSVPSSGLASRGGRSRSKRLYRVVPKIKTAGANLRALDVYRDALAFWHQFFQQHGL